MEDVQELSYAYWRQFEFAWRHAQEGWRDSTAEHFSNQFVNPLEYEMKNYLQALDSLVEILQEAQEEAR